MVDQLFIKHTQWFSRYGHPVVSLWIFFGCLLSQTLLLSWAEAPPTPEIVSLQVNNRLTVDMEAISWPDGSFSLPVKQLANVLDLPVYFSQQPPALTFTSPTTGLSVRLDVTDQRITHGDTVIEKLPHPLVFLNSGVFSQQEIYLDKAWVEEFMGLQVQLDPTTQTVNLSVNRPLKALLRLTQEADATAPSPEEGPPQITHTPLEKGRLLETLFLDLSTTTYQEVQQQPTFELGGALQTQFFNLGSTLVTGFNGLLGKVPYTFKPRWAYLNGDFRLSDLQGKAVTETRAGELSAGALTVGLSPVIAPNLPLWGVQIANRVGSQSTIASEGIVSYQGPAPQKGKVILNLNGFPYQFVFPKEGQYHFENVQLQANQINQVQIVQTTPEGKETLLFSESIPYYPQTLRAGEKAYSAFVGRTPFQFQPPGLDDSRWRLPQSNKWVTGGRYYQGLTDRFTVGVSVAGDTVFGDPQTSRLGQLLRDIQTPDLTGYLSYRRDPNLMSGLSLGTEALYRLGNHWTVSGNAGISQKHRLEDNPVVDADNFSLASQLAVQYADKKQLTSLKIFQQGTEYYTPITLGENNLYDRRGASFSSSGQIKGIIYQTGLDRYQTNLSDILAGGEVAINRWTGSLFRRWTPKMDSRLSWYWLKGENDEQELKSQDFQFDVSRRLPREWRFHLGGRRTNNQFLFNPTDPLRLVSVKQSNALAINYLLTQLDIPFPKHDGRIHLGGNFSNPQGLVNLQGGLRFGAIHLEPLLQSTVWGDQRLLTGGLGLYYEWAYGKRVGIRYFYNYATLPSIAALLGDGKRSSHQFQFDFTDTLTMLAGKLLSLGTQAESTGILEGAVFLDLNRNGKREAKEPGVPNIPVIIDNKSTLHSDKKGLFLNPHLLPGIHLVTYDFETLPIQFTPTSGAARSQIDTGRRTQVDLGVIVTPGNFSGTVAVKDAQGNPVNASDLVVRLLDENKAEMQFTYTDTDGHYSLGAIPPGKYLVTLDTKQLEQRRIKLLETPEPVEVPILYEGFFDQPNMNIQALQLLQGR